MLMEVLLVVIQRLLRKYGAFIHVLFMKMFKNLHSVVVYRHPIQGWTPDFIPLVLEQGLGLQDELIDIPDGAGVSMSQTLARNEGILTGISGGATMWAAVETAKKAPEGSVLVAMLPDTGERYLSTPLFASIEAEMNEEELEIARSTPNFILEPSPLVHSFSDSSFFLLN